MTSNLKNKICFLLIVLSMLIACMPTPAFPMPENPSGKITFQPNIIPELNIHFVEEFFRFQWLGNRFDLKLLIHCEGKNLSLRDFWEKTDRLVKWNQIKNKATDSMYEFGYMITDIPQEIADNVEYLVWKIEGASFDVDEIEIEKMRILEFEVEPYNITRFHLPDNLVLSYEDLWLYDFTVSHPNKHETIVKSVKGKTELNLDPILFSSGIITVIGGSEGSELDFKDIWDADQTGGWGVVHNNNETDTQFQFDARLIFGNGTIDGTTWFLDMEKEIFFSSLSTTANGHVLMAVSKYAHLTIGKMVNSTTKVSNRGCAFVWNNDNSRSYSRFLRPATDTDCEINIYSSVFTVKSAPYSSVWNCYDATLTINGDAWNLILNRAYLGGECADYTVAIVDASRLTISDARYGYVYGTTGTFNDIVILEAIQAIYFYAYFIVTFKNVKVVTSDLGTSYAINCLSVMRNKYLINADIDTWTMNWGGTSTKAIYRQYEFDLGVIFNNGSYAEGTNVTISNDYLGTSDSWILSSNGSIPTQTYSMGHYNQTGGVTLYDYNPYNLTASLNGFQTYSTLFNLTKKTDWKITLHASEDDEECYGNPVARFTFTPSNPIPILTSVLFNASTSFDNGSITEYEWNFGDGLGEDYALSFDGVNDYVDCGSGDNLTEWTLEAWVIASEVPWMEQPFISKGDEYVFYPKINEYWIDIGENQHWWAGFRDDEGTGHETDSINTYLLDSWVHLVATFNGSYIILYMNGTQDGISEDYSEFTPLHHSDTLYIGHGAGLPFNGTIDEVRIYNRAINSSEVSFSYNNGNGNDPLSETGLIHRWEMNEGVGTMIQDSVGANNGTLKNGVNWIVRGGYTGKIVNHTFTEIGNYNVTLTVTDNDELTDTFSQIINVDDVFDENMLMAGFIIAVIFCLAFGLALTKKK
ncbi:hypothetical protein ES702_02556 [subsurface metagenome]